MLSLPEQPMGFARPSGFLQRNFQTPRVGTADSDIGCLPHDNRVYSRSRNLASVQTHASELSCSGESSSGTQTPQDKAPLIEDFLDCVLLVIRELRLRLWAGAIGDGR